ncbi:MAG: thermonuclease family protein [Phycisphaerae bacterium]|nr:thermonuclease family protein [Phycisphaerae bacterium]MCZ2400848.1 thermonuclease family protein [Phycisphaerae bacterium]
MAGPRMRCAWVCAALLIACGASGFHQDTGSPRGGAEAPGRNADNPRGGADPRNAEPALPAPLDFREARGYAVIRLADERTIIVQDGSRERPVRLLGVARPHETAQRQAMISHIEHLLLGERVFLMSDDDLPRADGAAAPEAGSSRRPDESAEPAGPDDDAAEAVERRYVYRAPDGLFVNLELVRQGYAPMAARPDFSHRRLFRAYEHRARESARGIWRSSSLAPPAVQPAEPPTKAAAAPQRPPQEASDAGLTVYVTPNGQRYHRAGCSFLSETARPIPLAEARGKYGPCKRCKPPP